MATRSVQIIGHRGAPGYLPEHTASSYRLAITSGVDAVEPDVVLSRDGVLVVRHENEISGTTDVASRPEFAGRRRIAEVDGFTHDGWFTDDFDWAELATLKCRERLPNLRPHSAAKNDTEGLLRLVDLLALLDSEAERTGITTGLVVELKHAEYYRRKGFDLADEVLRVLDGAGWLDGNHNVTIESFEPLVLQRLHERDVPAEIILLIWPLALDEDHPPVVAPPDLWARDGEAATTYAHYLTAAGLDEVAQFAQGISLHWSTVLDESGPPVIEAAHDRGLRVLSWTARPEGAFLAEQYRRSDDPAGFGDYDAAWMALVLAGVDGVFVDHPDLGVSVLRRP